MLAKVIAHAPTRSEATLRLARALQGSRLRGVTTNRDFLVAALRHPEFQAGHTTTDFIERTDVARSRQPPPGEIRLAAWAAALAAIVKARATAPVLRSLPAGWRNSVMPPERRIYDHDAGTVEVGYRTGRDGNIYFGDDVVRLLGVEDGWVDFEAGGRRHRIHVLRCGTRVYAGDLTLRIRPRFPEAQRETVAGGLIAPMPGKVVSVEVQTGDMVEEGQLLMIMEAMKMEHRVTAPHAGMVGEIRAGPGDQVAGGDLLVVLS
jgi:propionyl-CoA carboxylase alpha chain